MDGDIVGAGLQPGDSNQARVRTPHFDRYKPLLPPLPSSRLPYLTVGYNMFVLQGGRPVHARICRSLAPSWHCPTPSSPLPPGTVPPFTPFWLLPHSPGVPQV